jgi:hypothetical protein
MHEILNSPYAVPLGGLLVGAVWVGFTSWRKVRERELLQESELRQKEMEHQLKLKTMDLELARLKESKPAE